MRDHHHLISAGSSTDIAVYFNYASSHFLELVNGIPELIEAYESVDSNGASARRYMVNDPKSHLEPTAASASSMTPKLNGTEAQQHGKAQSREASKNMAQASLEDDQAAKRSNSDSDIDLVARDMAFMERRYRSAFASTSLQPSCGATSDPKFDSKSAISICQGAPISASRPAESYCRDLLSFLDGSEIQTKSRQIWTRSSCIYLPA